MPNIVVENDGSLRYEPDSTKGLVYNMVQQMALERGEDKFYKNAGIEWKNIAMNTVDPLPSMLAVASDFTDFFLTKIQLEANRSTSSELFYVGLVTITAMDSNGNEIMTL